MRCRGVLPVASIGHALLAGNPKAWQSRRQREMAAHASMAGCKRGKVPRNDQPRRRQRRKGKTTTGANK
eukprot:scaffold215119_cov32-Tisochrysis_lutea.AAC.3